MEFQWLFVLATIIYFRAGIGLAENVTEIILREDPAFHNSSKLYDASAFPEDHLSMSNENGTPTTDENYYDQYEYDLLTSIVDYNLDIPSDYEYGNADNNTDSDDIDDFGDRARWSYASKFLAKECQKTCKNAGKPFARILGARCQCLCPLNAPTLDLCNGYGPCDKYCASLKYFKGGDCLYNNVCFCYCRADSLYDVTQVHTKEDDE